MIMVDEQDPSPNYNSHNHTSDVKKDYTSSTAISEKSADGREQSENTRIEGLLSWGSYHDGILEVPQEEIEKPQSKFIPKVDNSDLPFKPGLKSKPNAIEPLQIYLEMDKDGSKYYCHPYMPELKSFKVPPRQLIKTDPFPPSDTSIHDAIALVDNENSLADMVADLSTITEIAVDSEYHSFRSFYGFTCLLQISTRTKDYIIDTIALRSELEVLNKFFTDPKILKVMHAADLDIVWLQKDLNLYVINMFDTSIAANEIGFRQPGLGSLLKQVCGVIIEKSKDFQKYFDWRTRPLPREALLYSRDDTHYLLYLHDVLRNRLITKERNTSDLLMRVYNRSTDLCMKTFRKSASESGLTIFLRKCKKDGQRIHAMKSLYRWRDKMARELDESTGYVLPNRALLQLVETLPVQIEDIEYCCYPNTATHLVKKNLHHLHNLIIEALEQPIDVDSLRTKKKKIVEIRTQSTQTKDEKNSKICYTQSQSTQTESGVEERTMVEYREPSYGFLLINIWRRYLLASFQTLRFWFR